jgi:hypothetical protein
MIDANADTNKNFPYHTEISLGRGCAIGWLIDLSAGFKSPC